jgi:hypothetical protein
MVTPRWVDTRCQPIAINDVIETLVAAVTDAGPGVFELGGPDVVSYAMMMSTHARVAGLPRRRLLRVPFLTPGLSSHWMGLVTPVPAPLARELVESHVNEVVVDASKVPSFHVPHPLSLEESIARALAATNEGRVPTRFVDADLVHFRPSPTDPVWAGGSVLKDTRSITSAHSATAIFSAICSVGGERGWYTGSCLWRLRGFLDQLCGGPGLRRGRPNRLSVGAALDFWRVEELVENSSLGLYAEMRLPGQARLRWQIDDTGPTRTITQVDYFRPHGLLGRLYWLCVLPFHAFVFPGLLRGIVNSITELYD